MQCYLDFRFPHRLNHEMVILCEVKEAVSFSRRRQLPQSVIAIDHKHVISWIDCE
jgi:hypothetical protein